MTNYNPTLAVLAILVIMYIGYNMTKPDIEHYSGTGALTQLYAKGPQDLYLTNDAKKYIYNDYYRSYPYVESVWNNPTKIGYGYGYNNYYDLNRYYNRYYNHTYPLRTPSRYPHFPHYLNRNYLFPFLW